MLLSAAATVIKDSKGREKKKVISSKMASSSYCHPVIHRSVTYTSRQDKIRRKGIRLAISFKRRL
jgi:hypothetical protein